MSVQGCRHSAQDWYRRPGDEGGELFCSECDKQGEQAARELMDAYNMGRADYSKAQPLPTCVMCGTSLGKSLQAWIMGCCSGKCAEQRAVIRGVTATQLLDELYARLKPYWAGVG
jgi:hypothetical protein